MANDICDLWGMERKQETFVISFSFVSDVIVKAKMSLCLLDSDDFVLH